MKCLTNKIRVLLVVILTTLSLVATAQERFALVIGNSAYEDTNFLPNTLNDAQLVADTLESLDFKVTHLQDLDYRGMINARRQFVKQLPSKSVALFYYAGHQVQSGGDHYLLPIGSIDGLEEEYLSEDALSLNRIIADLEDKSELRLLFLDACRDNPLPNANKTSRGIKATYTPIINGTGTIVSFASQSGKPAYDGDAGNNSIYTKTLVDQMLQPNVSIVDMLEEVKNQVTKATKNTQQPRDNKKEFSGSFCFKVEGDVAGCRANIIINQTVVILEDGSSYVGQLIGSNTPHGKGVMTLANGDQLEGEWHNGDISKGKIETTDGVIYEGEIRDKQMHGNGEYLYQDGSRYVGYFTNGRFSGYGVMTWPSGKRYEGEWKNGRFDGSGVYLIPSEGVRYDGEWKDGRQNGKGVMSWPNGMHYDGEWIQGKRSGQGRFLYADGTFYQGEWRYGNQYGEGVETYLNGSRYEGEWKYGRKYGQGIMKHSNGTQEQQVYENGTLISSEVLD